MTGRYDELPDAVLVLDAERVIEEANEAAVSMLGHPAERMVGSRADELLAPRGRDGAPVWRGGWPAAVRLRSVGRVPEQRVRLRRADGSDLTVTATGRYRRGPDGELEGLLLVLRPTGRRDREATAGIEVVSTVSHELRSPLTSVKGFTSLMLNRWDRLGDDQKRQMVEQVHVDADRVTRLVTELLDISRLETGRLKLRRQMVEVAPLVEKVVEELRHVHPDLEPKVLTDSDLPEAYADPDKIMQVLTNLVENTSKYAAGAGVEVEARADGAGGSVVIEVRDQGPGIPARDLPKLFSKFFRSGEGRPTGSGLGLYIAKGIVEAHGGRMWVESTVGEGSTFGFSLPAGVPEELETGSEADAGGGE